MFNIPDPDRQPEFYESVPAKRLLAWVIDTVLTVAICILILPFTAFTGLFFFPLLIAVVGFIYRVLTLAAGSATWGMRLVAIELRDRDGARLDPGTALAHTIGYTVSFMMPVLQLISVVMMATGRRGQGLSDMVLGTVALNRRARGP